MKKLLRISNLLMVLIFLLACASCEKDSDNRSKEELLLAHIWNWNKMTTTSTNEEVQDLIAVFSVLMTGTTLEFHPDGSYTIASPLSDPDVADWELLDDNTILMDEDEMTIKKLTDSELILEGEEVDDDYGTYSVTLYWKK